MSAQCLQLTNESSLLALPMATSFDVKSKGSSDTPSEEPRKYVSVSPWSDSFKALAHNAEWVITSASPWSEDWARLTNVELGYSHGKIGGSKRGNHKKQARKGADVKEYTGRFYKSVSPFDKEFPPFTAKKSSLRRESVEFETFSPFDSRFPSRFSTRNINRIKKPRSYNVQKLVNEHILGVATEPRDINLRAERLRPVKVLPIDLLDDRAPESYAVSPWCEDFDKMTKLVDIYVTSVSPWSADWDRLTGNFKKDSSPPDMEAIGWAGFEMPKNKKVREIKNFVSYSPFDQRFPQFAAPGDYRRLQKTYYVSVSPFDERFPPFTAKKRSLACLSIDKFKTYSPFDSRFPSHFSSRPTPRVAAPLPAIVKKEENQPVLEAFPAFSPFASLYQQGPASAVVPISQQPVPSSAPQMQVYRGVKST